MQVFVGAIGAIADELLLLGIKLKRRRKLELRLLEIHAVRLEVAFNQIDLFSWL